MGISTPRADEAGSDDRVPVYDRRLHDKVASLNAEARRLHFDDAFPVDMHVHPMMSQQLFGVSLHHSQFFWRAFAHTQWPWITRASLPNLYYGGWRVVLANAHVPERQMMSDLPEMYLLRGLLRNLRVFVGQSNTRDRTRELIKQLEEGIKPARFGQGPSIADHFVVVRSPAALQAFVDESRQLATHERKTAVIHCIEGGHSLNPEKRGITERQVLDNLQAFHACGVAAMVLTHFYDVGIAAACYPFPDRTPLRLLNSHRWWNQNDGLNRKFGHAVVERMLELGMLIDMTHCTPKARGEVINMAQTHMRQTGRRPGLLMSHVGAYAVNPSPYNPTDEEIRAIAELGGVVGVIWMQYWLSPGARLQGLDAVVQTIKAIQRAGGELGNDVVSIGSDLDGLSTPPDDLRDASDLPRLTDRLLAEGFPPVQIKQILGGNALRVLLECWRKS